MVIELIERLKESLYQLSKDQLIYLIEQMDRSLFLIGEVCVEESKQHIESDKAIREIRDCIYRIPRNFDSAGLAAYIDFREGKISKEEYRKLMGFE